MHYISLFFAMLRDIFRGRYPMPWKTFGLALLCAVYFLSPIDLLPDFLPILGVTDDVSFVLLVLALLKKDLDAYQNFLKSPHDKVIDLGDIKEHKK